MFAFRTEQTCMDSDCVPVIPRGLQHFGRYLFQSASMQRIYIFYFRLDEGVLCHLG